MFKWCLWALIGLTANASSLSHEFNQTEMKCLVNIDNNKLKEKAKRFNITSLPEKEQFELAETIVNAEVLKCIEKEINK